ncbi:flagellar assembly peptidoglycan hydrolase FlgJ [Chitinasiproducens palmae]|uniref:Peptidoglycan hydrolase FlgJ n=1 Tax=Chitinasiproducens palmae TaxID=1770053 RepID=A0A1H2PJY6_9BURK|nr:flagellar assembly peptidoglycan hydrolase FlgJ [Chitinasiproducens palmae]SDV46601.1 flagellar protein FlgJ [Chitinasiproducens palmae]
MNDGNTTVSSTSGDISRRFALDTQGLDALRRAARSDPQQAARAAAKQFDAAFLQMMLKSMRDATPSDGLLDSQGGSMVTSMLDQQLAQQLSSKGVGLADMMVQQLARAQGGAGASAGTAAGGATGAQAYATQGGSLGGARAFSADGSETSTPLLKGRSSSAAANDFIERLAPAAQAASESTGIPAHYILSQVALESGWGKREIRTRDGSRSHNVLGVKAGGDWSGPTVDVTTTEYVNGRPHRTVAKFRAYGSYHEALQDYANVLKNNSRYQPVLRAASNPAAFAHGLQKAGYATDPHYGKKLLAIIKQMV